VQSVPDPPVGEYDLVVVGAGILGLAVAREWLLRRPGSAVAVLERERDVGLHQTGHNSGVVHAGIYYAPGSLKARLCVEGARELYDYCDARGVPAHRCGKVVVATRPDELAGLEELERRGRANGVPGLRQIGPGELRELEPHARGLAALHSPATGLVDFAAVARALAEDVRGSGGVVAAGCAVEGVESQVRVGGGARSVGGGGAPSTAHGVGPARASGRVELRLAGGVRLRAGRAILCAGLWSDRIARRAGAGPDPRIVPFRGAYHRLPRARGDLVRALIYPVPDAALPFLGVHLTRQPDGEVLIGPTALLAGARDAYRLGRVRAGDLAATLTWPGTWRLARRWWRTALSEVHRAASPRALAAEAARFVPEVAGEDLEPAFAGVRAQALGRDGRLLDDFVFSETAGPLHVRNAPSPAATACLAIAHEVVDRLERTAAG
jgi:L-2-hydroxyglutarate oxidase